jgi:hypothetical protein
MRSRPPAPTTAPGQRIPFYALAGADTISMNGNALAQLAVPWFVLETTGSAALTGIAAFFGLLPLIPGAFLGGPSSTGSGTSGPASWRMRRAWSRWR